MVKVEASQQELERTLKGSMNTLQQSMSEILEKLNK